MAEDSTEVSDSLNIVQILLVIGSFVLRSQRKQSEQRKQLSPCRWQNVWRVSTLQFIDEIIKIRESVDDIEAQILDVRDAFQALSASGDQADDDSRLEDELRGVQERLESRYC